jgi:hypothetical protein
VIDTEENRAFWTATYYSFGGSVAGESQIRAAHVGGGCEVVNQGLDGKVGALGFIALDGADDRLYWTELQFFDLDKIRRASSDGTGNEIIQTSSTPFADLELDTVNDKLYWVKQPGPTTINRSNTDGSDVEVVISPGAGVYGLFIDAVFGKLYWTQGFGEDRVLRRAGLDGANPEDLCPLPDAEAFVVDVSASPARVYWIGEGGPLLSAELDGSDQETVVESTEVELGNDLMLGADDPVGPFDCDGPITVPATRGPANLVLALILICAVSLRLLLRPPRPLARTRPSGR